ncbi:CAP domain-containing protein [Allohahella sp. A8]|uniref:CAP domain-containing protein n=1 Tax=Allohahella sp. A8 TaxID=3141461 RepID=UPI003A80E7D1
MSNIWIKKLSTLGVLVIFQLLAACGGSSGNGSGAVSPAEPGEGSGNPAAPGGESNASTGTFSVTSSSPSRDSTNRALDSVVRILFNQPLIDSTVVSQHVSLSRNGVATVTALQYDNTEHAITLIPAAALAPDTLYTVSLSAGLMAENGESMKSQNWTFRTAGNVGSTSQATIDSCMSDTDLEMLDAVNRARAVTRSCGSTNYNAVPALSWNCQLDTAANRHARDMVNHDFFSHTGSDGSSMGGRISAAGYNWSAAAENIAAGQSSVTAVMNGWLASDGHCRNIMSSSTTQLGVALAIADPGTTAYGRYWVQNFARPQN